MLWIHGLVHLVAAVARLLWWQRQGSITYSHPLQSVGKYSWTAFALHSPHELLLKNAEKRQAKKRYILSPVENRKSLGGSLALVWGIILVNLETFAGMGCTPSPFPVFLLILFLKTAKYLILFIHTIALFSIWKSLNNYFHWQLSSNFLFQNIAKEKFGAEEAYQRIKE